MGYVTRDAVGPAIATYVTATRIRNQILAHWPRVTIDGREVFGQFTYYNGAVITTPDSLAIYKMLGMSVEELQAQDYTGIDRSWLYINGVDIEYAVTPTQTAAYIEEFSPLIYPDNLDVFNPDPTPDPITDLNPDPFKNTDDAQWDNQGWCYAYLTYAPPSTVHIAEDTSDAALIAMAQANDLNTLWFDNDDSNRLTAIAMLDTTNLLFQKEYRIVEKTIEHKTTHTVNLNNSRVGSNSSRYIIQAIVQFRFRRIVDANDVSVSPLLDLVGVEVAKLDDILKTGSGGFSRRRNSIRELNVVGESLQSSYAKQLTEMYRYVVPISETNLNYNGQLKVSGLLTLTNKQFVTTFMPQIANGYDKKKTKWYKKVLVAVITIIVVIIAIVLLFTPFAWASPLVLSLGAIVQGQLANYWAKHGDYDAAGYAVKHSEFLSTGAMVVGVYNVLNATWQAYLENQLAQAALAGAGTGADTTALSIAADLASAELTQAMINAATMLAAVSASSEGNDDLSMALSVLTAVMTGYKATGAVSTGEVLTQWIAFLNQSFNIYANYINPPNKGLKEKAEELAETEKQLEDASGPEVLDAIYREWTDPYNNYIDTNAKMDEMPYAMTHGKNRSIMHKYYNSDF